MATNDSDKNGPISKKRKIKHRMHSGHRRGLFNMHYLQSGGDDNIRSDVCSEHLLERMDEFGLHQYIPKGSKTFQFDIYHTYQTLEPCFTTGDLAERLLSCEVRNDPELTKLSPRGFPEPTSPKNQSQRSPRNTTRPAQLQQLK